MPWSSSSSRVYYLGKDRRDVVPIADADSFRDLKPPTEDRREEGNGSSRWNVRPNLNGTEIHAVYFEDPDYFEFQRGKRRATGICGDVWSVLADLLNFTLVVTRSRTRSLGTVVHPADRSSSSSSSNDKNFTDLLGLVQQGRYEAIPKMEAFVERLAAVDFTRSIWKDRYRLFVRPYYRFKSLWMLDLFSWQVWAAAGLFYLLLVAVNVAASRWSSSDDVPRVVVACSSSADYLFYGFGALCNQGEPLYLALWESSSRLLALSTGLFSWLLLVSYGSQLVIFMQQTYSPAPFSSLDALLDETDYAILAERHSIVEIGFRKNYRPVYARIQRAERIAFLDTHQEMWSLACSQAGGLPAADSMTTTTTTTMSSSERPYAVLQSEYARTAELAPCELVPVPGESYFKTWIVAGLAKGCRHKRAIDSG
uniref:Ionotropic glutamate receptor C-terminal domain-containing protein n=1 Tax=Trichogramma kaykai TaxID=54128 RepID=A0ABD2XII7_9HYME